jgi:hypothetical protein
MHEPERVVDRADLSDSGCTTPLHLVCVLGNRHALRIRNGRALIEYEIGPCPNDRCAKATRHT